MKFPNYKLQSRPEFPRHTFEQKNLHTQRLVTARGYRGLTKEQMQQLRPFVGFNLLIRYHKESKTGYDNAPGVGTLLEVKPNELELDGIPQTIKRGDIQYVDLDVNQTSDQIIRTRIRRWGGIGLELKHAKSGYKVWIINHPSVDNLFHATAMNQFNADIAELGEYKDEESAEEAGMKWLREARGNLVF